MKEDIDIREKKRDEVWERLKKEFEKHEFDSSRYIDYVMVGCKGGMRWKSGWNVYSTWIKGITSKQRHQF